MVRFTLRVYLFTVAGAILLGPSIAAEEPTARHDLGESMPQVLYASYSNHSYATWVAVSAALEPSGKFDERLFHPHVLDQLEYHLSKPTGEDGCLQYGPVFQDLVGAPDWGTLDKVLLNTDLVVRGAVVGKEYGFKGSVPGQLLKLRAEKTFKAPLEHLDFYYVFFPVGELKVGDLRICKTDPRFPPPPEVGDELIVSVPHRRNLDEPLLKTEVYGGQGYITLKGDTVYLSPSLQKNGQEALVTNRGELLSLIDHVLKGGS